MEGRKIEEARLAVKQLVTNLDAQDRLAIVRFSHGASLVAPPTLTTPAGKSALVEAVEELTSGGNTNMSEGAALSLELLQGAPRQVDDKEALRRVIVFTDGHANEGIDERDRKGWGELFAKQLGDASVSWFGFGEDHDAHFLSDLADLTKGNSYVAKDADAIGTAFAQELGSLIGIVAKELRIRLTGLHGTPVVLNDEKIDIVDFSDDLPKFVAHALSPAKVSDAFLINAEERQVRVLVPDFQLSLAIGKEGQNARLAAKLTGAKIDIQPDSILEDD
jgi:hypothetical protein